jgi:hypothetical protein
MITLGYLELSKNTGSLKFKDHSSVKNIFTNIHKNYLVFMDFLYKNLTKDQINKTKKITERIFTILNERPTAKIHYGTAQMQTLKTNNEMSLSMLKSLLRNNSNQNDFMKGSSEIIKNIDSLSVSWVKNKIIDLIKASKQTRHQSSLSVNDKITAITKSDLKPIRKVLIVNDKIDSNKKYATKHFTPQKNTLGKAKVLLSDSKPKYNKVLQYRKVKPVEFLNSGQVKKFSINL